MSTTPSSAAASIVPFPNAALEHVDVLIVGAGLSGIGAAWHLQDKGKGKTYAILEARDASGGTWDLFRYPGIRSDSDMHTLGYNFRPWTQSKAIADGPSILSYVRATASEAGIDRNIRYGLKVRRASWSTPDARWSVEAERVGTGETVRMTASFLYLCGGYYSYDKGYRPAFQGEADFKGTIVHPQFWPEGLDYAGKRVVVIGSGATAVTLVPEMAKKAAHVTMLQRSPTWMATRPAEDALANRMRRLLPAKMAYALTRWKNVFFQQFFYRMTRTKPEKVKERLLALVKEKLPAGYPIEKHFTPRYNPWDQRVCLVPDDDLFVAIKEGKASVVTDTIETFTGTGIRTSSGEELQADIIVTATGLELKVWNGVEIAVDGKRIEPRDTISYKSMMFSGVPNMALTFGYTNASWTLKADLTAGFVCRLLNHFDKTGLRQATPVNDDPNIELRPWLDFSSGYVQRAMDSFPRQATKAPWIAAQSYWSDVRMARFGRLDDGVLRFTNPKGAAAAAPQQAVAEAAE
jgi:monooxygenase